MPTPTGSGRPAGSAELVLRGLPAFPTEPPYGSDGGPRRRSSVAAPAPPVRRAAAADGTAPVRTAARGTFGSPRRSPPPTPPGRRASWRTTSLPAPRPGA
jgi:hypothetical protein